MTKEYETPKLPYAYNALEPHIDEETMRIHHDKHHVAYTTKLNVAVSKHPELFNKEPEELLENIDALPANIRIAVRNNGGGHVNHAFFWSIMKKDTTPQGKILEAINKTFGSIEEFKAEFTTAAATQFGSGWAWLASDVNGKLSAFSTANQDTPISEGKLPLIALDVWEHAYYLKYQNKRPDYIEAFFNVIDWEQVNKLYETINA